ncbi:MAG: metallopeptidase TldD-related protein [candidate division WOR-3 bacterium]|nr:metallopeptidase TldD-related protein [candidate division WOR-3 bacterium]
MEKLMIDAKKIADKVEIYSSEEVLDSISFENSKLKDIDTKIQSGVSLRIIKDGKLGFAYTKNLKNREELIQNAISSLKGGVETGFDFPFNGDSFELNTYDPAIESFSNGKIVDECKRVSNALSSKTAGQINLMALRKVHKIRIINSRDSNLTTKFSEYFFNAEALYPGSYSSIGRSIISKKFQRMTDEDLDFILRIYNSSMEEVNIKTGRMKVLFLPEAMFVLIWRLLSATSGKNIYEKKTPLIEKIGERIFDEKLEIYDDPLNDRMPYARSFDDEGTPCKRLTIIEDGILRNFYYDLYYADKMEKVSTGNGYKTAMWGGETVSIKPSPALEHLYITPGGKSLSELITSIDRGVIIAGVLGAHSGNIPNGDFSIGLSPGIYVKNGKMEGRVKDVMIAGNIYTTMKNIVDIEDTLHPGMMGSFPAVLFDEVSVTTKD